MTDTDIIVATANNVDQKSGAAVDSLPNQPVAITTLTAIDGSLITAGSGGNSSSRRRFAERSTRRSSSDYELIFPGTGTGPYDRDAAIEGTAYLTYTLVPNATYNVDDCLNKCDQVETCGKNNILFTTNKKINYFVFFLCSLRQPLLRVR